MLNYNNTNEVCIFGLQLKPDVNKSCFRIVNSEGVALTVKYHANAELNIYAKSVSLLPVITRLRI